MEEIEEKGNQLSDKTRALQEAKDEVVNALEGQKRATMALDALQQENHGMRAALEEQERSFHAALKVY